MVNESVLNGVRKYLRALQDQGVAVKFGIVFGSQVAGNTDIRSLGLEETRGALEEGLKSPARVIEFKKANAV